tara:strand:+ start:4979 stop:5353 length:375 start_codon:yes stop_codon:yes gene_type:complete
MIILDDIMSDVYNSPISKIIWIISSFLTDPWYPPLTIFGVNVDSGTQGWIGVFFGMSGFLIIMYRDVTMHRKLYDLLSEKQKRLEEDHQEKCQKDDDGGVVDRFRQSLQYVKQDLEKEDGKPCN